VAVPAALPAAAPVVVAVDAVATNEKCFILAVAKTKKQMIDISKGPSIVITRIFLTSFLFIYILFDCISLHAQVRIPPVNNKTIQPGIRLSNIKAISRITGDSLNGEAFPSPNNTAAIYDVGGTDLGIIWVMNGNRIGLFFGDTNGKDFVPGKDDKGGGNGSNWRSNVLAFSDDADLENGLTINSMLLDDSGKAREICAGAKTNPGKYNTSIPTAAIRAAGIDYVHYMNIYEWAGGNGRWLTNFSSLYASKDQGKTWMRKKEVTFKPDSKFSQVTYAKKDGFVYMLGTLSGRGSGAWLARFKERDMLKMKNYEYWNGDSKKWVKNNEEAATVVITGPVGEASLLYHETYKRWVLAYNYDAAYDPKVKKRMHALVYRDANELNGNWSEMKTLTTEKEFPGLYSPYFHPLKNKGNKVYFTMSLWKPYNVFLMSADIDLL
jgi:hypothetical protein